MKNVILAFVLIAPLALHALSTRPETTAPTSAAARPNFGKLPLSFQPNQGQSEAQIKFTASGQGYSLHLTQAGAELSLSKASSTVKQHTPHASSLRTIENQAEVIGMSLLGANHNSSVTGTAPLPGKVNFFRGSDPTRWLTNIPTYAQVRYTGVYPGVDLVYYGNQQQLEYDFIVAPGASAQTIRLSFSGTRQVSIAANGNLVLRGRQGAASFHKPVVYQELNGRHQPVAGQFRVVARNTVSFKLGSYDHTRALVIDPVLIYATYLGGSGNTLADTFGQEAGNGIAVDSTGNVYVVGTALSTDFPVTGSAFQQKDPVKLDGGGASAFVTKFNPTGTALIYSTYIGGTGDPVFVGGSGYGDYGKAIALDASGNAYITGTAFSGDFPVTAGAFQKVNHAVSGESSSSFVTKLNATGSALVYSTFLGGSGGSYGDPGDIGAALQVDTEGDVFITGSAMSYDFPVTAHAFQKTHTGDDSDTNVFVAKLNPSGTALLYATYLGGDGRSKVGPTDDPGDKGNGIAVDGKGNAYVTGSTKSTNFPITPGAFQTVNKGSQGDQDEIYGSGGSNGFVTKLNADGSKLLYSTYLGGIGDYFDDNSAFDASKAIAVDDAGHAYVAGVTSSTDFPVTPGVLSNTGDYEGAGFITKLSPDGSSLEYSTYLSSGGASVQALAVGSDGTAYVTGTAGTGFVVTQDAIPAQTCCSFVAKVDPQGASLVYGTQFGGSGPSTATSIALDAEGSVYITGSAAATDLPVTDGAFQTTDHALAVNQTNAFVAKLALAGEKTSRFPTTTAVSPSTTVVTQGQSITLTATVTNVGTHPIPAGKVTFSGTVTVPGQDPSPFDPVDETLDGSGVADWVTSTLTPGNYLVNATYDGDETHLPSSAPVQFSVTGPPAVLVSSGQSNGSSFQYGNARAVFTFGALVQDSFGNPVAGVTVNFNGAGLSFSPVSAVTGADGRVVVQAIPTDVGTFTATASVVRISQPITYAPVTITPAPLTVILGHKARFYGDPNPPINYAFINLVGSDTINVVTHVDAPVTSPVGDYPVTGTVSGPDTAKYIITVANGVLQVRKRRLNVLSDSVRVTYGQTPGQLSGFSFTGFVNGDLPTVVSGAPGLATSVTATTPVGYYPLEIGPGTLNAVNYFFYAPAHHGVVQVYKAMLTVTPNDVTIRRGDPLPAFTYSVTGFVNGDSLAGSVTGAPQLSTSASSQSGPGTFPIYLSTYPMKSGSYDFTEVTGKLTILP